jgi:3-phenylpropionate/trans-cinnamate dioxygenase ferredoxin component
LAGEATVDLGEGRAPEPGTGPLGDGEMAGSADWIAVGAADDLPPGSARVVAGVEPALAIFSVGGSFYATDDTCTHAKSSLAGTGYLEGDVVECAYHFAKFCVRDGSPLTPPARRPLRTHEVCVVDGEVYVRRPT